MIDKLKQECDNIRERLIIHRRFFHENAETGFDTQKSAKYIYDTLSSLGIECRFIGKNGVLGKLFSSNTKKTVLLRADIDALKIEEKTGLDFACKSGNMHACGHDMHTAMLLGCAELLAGMKESLSANVIFLFQPGEELLCGAKHMIDEGALNGADCAVTVHVLTDSEIPTGSVLLSYDTPSAPSADFYKVTVKGKGCHGSSPSIGIDPIYALCKIITTLDEIKTRELSIHEKFIMTQGYIHGGDNANVIPDTVSFGGSLRCFDEEARKYIKLRFEEITKGIAESLRCTADIEYTSSCPCLINNRQFLDITKNSLQKLLGQDKVIVIKDTKSKIQGSEDFSYISQALPSVSIAIAAGRTSDGYSYPLHNPKAIFDENALITGCMVFACNALDTTAE